jgi:[ribosomal protein S18]-alanine N-acetyltransferase
MSAQPRKKSPAFVILWEFRVPAAKRREFEKAYAFDGVWAKFFRSDANYIRTELLRDGKQPLRYFTIDVWQSRLAYARFKKQNAREYRAIDKQCQTLTKSERLIGEFEGIEPLPVPTVGARKTTADSHSRGEQLRDKFLTAQLSIRPAALEDIPAIVALERETPSAAHWRAPAYRRVFDSEAPPRIALVAATKSGAKEAIHGFVVARVAGDECELENILVAPKSQQRGIGSNLMRSLISVARQQNVRRIFLEVRESNSTARALYENCGFGITGRRSSYYTDPVEDAILYALEL